MFADLLTPTDAEAALATLDRLRQAGLERFALTGGTAIAWHVAEATGTAERRPLHDLDLLVADLDAIPARLGDAVLLWHVHPGALPGRMLVQAMDPSTALRIDVFGAYGRSLHRSLPVRFGPSIVAVASRSDIVARLTALLLDLSEGEAVPAKHARDFLALADHVTPDEMSAAWADHRRRRDPEVFADAHRAIAALIEARADLLVEAVSVFAEVPCPRCGNHPTLKRAAPDAIDAVRRLGWFGGAA